MNSAVRIVFTAISGLLALHAVGVSAGTAVIRGEWLKGDFHVHSRRSKDSTNNSVGKIVRFAEDPGFDFRAITDHDNHVDGGMSRCPPGSQARWWRCRTRSSSTSIRTFEAGALWRISLIPPAV